MYRDLEKILRRAYDAKASQMRRATVSEILGDSTGEPVYLSSNPSNEDDAAGVLESYPDATPAVVLEGVFYRQNGESCEDWTPEQRSPSERVQEWFHREKQSQGDTQSEGEEVRFCFAYRRAAILDAVGLPRFIIFDGMVESLGSPMGKPRLIHCREGHHWWEHARELIRDDATRRAPALRACRYCGARLVAQGPHYNPWAHTVQLRPTLESRKWAARQHPLVVQLPRKAATDHPHGKRFASYLQDAGHEVRIVDRPPALVKIEELDVEVDDDVLGYADTALEALWVRYCNTQDAKRQGANGGTFDS